MTGEEWLRSTEVRELIWELEGPRSVLQFKAGRRKARLMACAWCRPLLAYLSGEWGAAVIEIVEGFAEGRLGKAELAVAREIARENAIRVTADCAKIFTAARPRPDPGTVRRIAAAAYVLLSLPMESSPSMLGGLLTALTHATGLAPTLPNGCDAVREVFGNPFAPVKVAPAWLRRNDGAVRRLAATIYDGRAFAEAPVLADALEDAGCDNDAILQHLRGPGPHVRGCWALDLLLGKA